MVPSQDNQRLLILQNTPFSSPPSGGCSVAADKAMGQFQACSSASTFSCGSSRLISRSSREDPFSSFSSTHFGFLPRPAQVCSGLSGLWYFGLTPRRMSSALAPILPPYFVQ